MQPLQCAGLIRQSPVWLRIYRNHFSLVAQGQVICEPCLQCGTTIPNAPADPHPQPEPAGFLLFPQSAASGGVTLLVIGLMLGFTVQGLVSVIVHFANRIGGRVYSGWNDGTFASTTSGDLVWLTVPVLAGGVLAILAAKPLSSLLLGETYARSLGTDVSHLRWLTLSAVVILVAPVTAFCGPVTFIGLIVPHFARAIARTSRIPPLLPLAALSGALLAISADAVVHLPWEQHFLHLNAILAIIGAPVVILLLLFSPAMRGKP